MGQAGRACPFFLSVESFYTYTFLILMTGMFGLPTALTVGGLLYLLAMVLMRYERAW